jgi:hypothetical protein
MRLEYKIDSNNTLFIIPSVNLQDKKTASLSSLRTTNAVSDSVNSSLANSNSDRNGYNIRNNIMYRHSFPKQGRTLSLGFNTTFTKNVGESVIDAKYRYYDSLGVFTETLCKTSLLIITPTGHAWWKRCLYRTNRKKGQLQMITIRPFRKIKTIDRLTDGSKYTQFDTTHPTGLTTRSLPTTPVSATACRPVR